MKNALQKQIEKRTGEILREYTTFQGHLLNFIQQYHCYDLLQICKKIYDKKQQLQTNQKLDWDTHKHYILFGTKSKSYRKEQITYPDYFEPNERIDFDKMFEDCWAIVEKPFVLKKSEHDELLAYCLNENTNDREKICDDNFKKILHKTFCNDLLFYKNNKFYFYFYY